MWMNSPFKVYGEINRLGNKPEKNARRSSKQS